MARDGRVPVEVGWALCAAAALVWLWVTAAYLNYWGADRQVICRDLTDQVAAPLLSLALIAPMLLCAQGLEPISPQIGRLCVDICIVLVVLLGGWLTGQWIYAPLDIDNLHPGYFLPTVAGGLLASDCASAAGQPLLAMILFGLGLTCWLILGSIMLTRLFVRPSLPAPLLPTLAIEVAPAAIASLAWLRLHNDQVDALAAILAGYGLLMVLAQFRLMPVYRRLPFMPSTWSFTFSWAAVATTGIAWLETLQPTSYVVWQYALLIAITPVRSFGSSGSNRSLAGRMPMPSARTSSRSSHRYDHQRHPSVRHRCPADRSACEA